jgi:hypothetical protein
MNYELLCETTYRKVACPLIESSFVMEESVVANKTLLILRFQELMHRFGFKFKYLTKLFILS